MKSTRINIVIAAIFLLSFSPGCRKNYVMSPEQGVYFQVDYVNYAWGYQHKGFIIDASGNVLIYDNPAGWNFPDSDFILTGEQMAENIKQTKPSGYRISAEELQKYAGFIKNISLSKITAIRNSASDAGTSEYICYQFSEEDSSYKGYLIKMEGDLTCENLNFYSKKVAAWMKEINSNLPLN